jgi:hypothetical protein
MKSKSTCGPRQGDVLLIPVKAIPVDAVAQPPTGKKVILALGESTGHHHRFEFVDRSDGVKLLKTGSGERYLQVETSLGLLHEEHATVPGNLVVGKWLLPQQMEYKPVALTRVVD